MGSRFNRYPGHPNYKGDSRKVNGQYRSLQTVCRIANLPHRARRGLISAGKCRTKVKAHPFSGCGDREPVPGRMV